MPVQTKDLEYSITPFSKSYRGLKRVLIEKLTALQGDGDVSLFTGVYGVSETQPDGYPSVFVLERTGKGQILDTHRNEREWQFSVVIHQTIDDSNTPEEAYDNLLDATDRVISAFDQDPMLKDSNGQARCKWTRVLPLEFEFAEREATVHRALLVVSIVDIVNRYAA